MATNPNLLFEADIQAPARIGALFSPEARLQTQNTLGALNQAKQTEQLRQMYQQSGGDVGKFYEQAKTISPEMGVAANAWENQQRQQKADITRQTFGKMLSGGATDDAIMQGAQMLKANGVDDATISQMTSHLQGLDVKSRQRFLYDNAVKLDDMLKGYAPADSKNLKLEAIVGKDGKPVLVPAEQAVGQTPYVKPSGVNINLGAPPKPAQGFRNVQKDGEWVQEAIPGSKQWQDLKSKEATDRAFVQSTVPTIDKNIKDIEKFISMPGFENIFGLTGDLPSVLPSSRAAVAQRDQVVGAMETAGFNLMKSTAGSAGTMSQQEWPKMQTYLNILKNTTDPQQAKDALAGAVESYKRMREIAREQYANEWAGGQFGSPDVLKRLEAPAMPKSSGNIDSLLEKYK